MNTPNNQFSIYYDPSIEGAKGKALEKLTKHLIKEKIIRIIEDFEDSIDDRDTTGRIDICGTFERLSVPPGVKDAS